MFQIELRNKFHKLQVVEDDVEDYNNNLIAIINEAAKSIAGNTKPVKIDKISDSTKDMLRRRREMNQNGTKYGKHE